MTHSDRNLPVTGDYPAAKMQPVALDNAIFKQPGTSLNFLEVLNDGRVASIGKPEYKDYDTTGKIIPPPTAVGYGNKGEVSATNPNATKYDADKARPSLILVGMADSIRGVVAVGGMGAKKYADNAWKDVPNAQARYLDALYRHLDNIAQRGHQSIDIDMQPDGKGGYVDKGSGLLEWFHIAWNALALSWFAVQEAKRQATR